MRPKAVIDHNRVTIYYKGYEIAFVPDQKSRIHCVTAPWRYIGISRKTKAYMCRYAGWIINQLYPPRKKAVDRTPEMI